LSQRGIFAFDERLCSSPSRLYCLEIGNNTPLPAPVSTMGVKRVFVSTPWTPNGGRPAADAVCAADASAAGLTGSFLALLTTSTEDRLARISGGGASVYQRVDGITIGALNANAVQTFANMNAKAIFVANDYAWLGDTNQNCNDWTTTTGSGFVGIPFFANSSAFGSGPTNCNQAQSIYCVEQ
jgi:hypothetical protein